MKKNLLYIIMLVFFSNLFAGIHIDTHAASGIDWEPIAYVTN